MKPTNNSSKLGIWSNPASRRASILGIFGLALAALVPQANAQLYGLTNTWSVAAGTDNVDSGSKSRGMAYYAPSNLVIVNNSTTHVIQAYDGTTGAPGITVNNSGISGGTYTLNKLGTSSDGVLYAANLTTSVSSGTYKIYRWTNLTVAPTVAYTSTSGDPLVSTLGGFRIGDTFQVTGGGTNTLILASLGSTNAYALFSTTDGVNFTPTVITIPANQFDTPTPGGVQFGYTFYTNNTFVVNPNDGQNNLYLIQYPANFASLASPVAATVLLTNHGVISGIYLDMSYNIASGLLATHANSYEGVDLYTLPSNNFGGFTLQAANNISLTTSGSINAGATGEIALGGSGFTNDIYTLETSAGVQGMAIKFNSFPSITTQPSGGIVYTNVGSFTLSVAASGASPLSYQWQYNTVSNLATATNIAGATSSSYTINPLVVSNTGYYDVVITNASGSVTSVPVLLTVEIPISNPVVSNVWNIAPGSSNYPYLDSTSRDVRGLAYDTNTQTVLVADKGTYIGIYVLDANTGTNLFQLQTSGIGVTGNQFNLDQVGVGDDGVVYACNLYDASNTTNTFAIFTWPSVSASAPGGYAFGPGNPANTGDRWGDTMAVRGAGTNTQILLGTYKGTFGGPATNAALLTNPNGTGFVSTLLTITNATGVPAGFSSLGIAFGAGNTFWAKSPNLDLLQIAFDPVSGNCSVIQDIPSAANISSNAFATLSSIGVDPVNNILAGINFADVPNDLTLFGLGSATNAAPYAFDQAFFPSFNGNIQDSGATTVKFPRIYSLDVNNGIIALSYTVPLLPFGITSVSDTGSTVKLTFQSVPGRTYQVQVVSKLSGTPAWVNLGSPILATNTVTSYTDTSTNASGKAGYYQVIGH